MGGGRDTLEKNGSPVMKGKVFLIHWKRQIIFI